MGSRFDEVWYGRSVKMPNEEFVRFGVTSVDTIATLLARVQVENEVDFLVSDEGIRLEADLLVEEVHGQLRGRVRGQGGARRG